MQLTSICVNSHLKVVFEVDNVPVASRLSETFEDSGLPPGIPLSIRSQPFLPHNSSNDNNKK